MVEWIYDHSSNRTRAFIVEGDIVGAFRIYTLNRALTLVDWIGTESMLHVRASPMRPRTYVGRVGAHPAQPVRQGMTLVDWIRAYIVLHARLDARKTLLRNGVDAHTIFSATRALLVDGISAHLDHRQWFSSTRDLQIHLSLAAAFSMTVVEVAKSDQNDCCGDSPDDSAN